MSGFESKPRKKHLQISTFCGEKSLYLSLIILLLLVMPGCDGQSANSNEQVTLPPDASSEPSDAKSPETSSLLEGIDPVMADLGDSSSVPSPEKNSLETVVLEDIHLPLGIDFEYDNGHSPKRLMNESIGGGVGWVDFDQDGLLDLYFAQGGPSDAVERSTNPTDELFRNTGSRFERVTESAGIREQRYGDGVAGADYNADGFEDIYVTNVGRDALLLNQGDGTFTDVALEANTVNHLWGASAAWCDIDADGLLDLYVCNYLDYDPANPVACFDDEGDPRICHPDNVGPAPNRMFMNQGDGRFVDSLKERGLDADNSKSLGVAIADFNGDQTPDIFVANDTTYNHLFLNDGHGQFHEDGVAAGCAVSGRGQFQASMGVGFGDYNRDGNWDLYLTHFASDSNTMYQGLGGGLFQDVTREESLHEPTLPYLGFGAVIADLDCNGADEIFVANGHVDEKYAEEGDNWKMNAQLFGWNGSRWVETTSESGPYFQNAYLGRGVAVGDLNNDGYPELAVVNQRDQAAILQSLNRHNHWLNISCLSESGNRKGIGAVVRVHQSGRTAQQVLAGGTSYCASHEKKLFFGLGSDQSVCTVTVRWPDGRQQSIENVAADQHLIVRDRGI